MAIDIKIPSLGESVTEGTVSRWLKADGDVVAVDEIVLELETDKAAMEIPAPVAGKLKILVPAGQAVKVGAVVGSIDDTVKAAAQAPAAKAPAAPVAAADSLSPAVRRIVEEKKLDPSQVAATGKDGRLTKGDVLAHLERGGVPQPGLPTSQVVAQAGGQADADSERVPMTRLRLKIAERLVQAQQTAAILTTFNEIDMTATKELRARYNPIFEKKYGTKLGFMSLFGRACISALKDVREVNAQIDGSDLVYYNRVHLGIAVGTERGLVVPVVRNADLLSIAELELAIAALAAKARQGKLVPDDLSGGTFTISNGGVYGSLLSTPILNPPQTGILGMHKTEDRPVVVDGQIVVRPMMYVALSYDHRVIDGEQAVTFLVKVKQNLEDPQRMLLGV